MPIYNKDGTEFKLSGPNPIMKNQDLWGEFTIHNMDFLSKTFKFQTKTPPPPVNLVVKESFLEALDAAKNEIVEPPPKPKEENILEKTFIYCLPAEIKQRSDSLYGDVYQTIQYGNPTSFEGVIISQSDIILEIWTDANFDKGSILYPKTNSKRWWRVQEKKPKASGWLLASIPSDFQPSFDN